MIRKPGKTLGVTSSPSRFLAGQRFSKLQPVTHYEGDVTDTGIGCEKRQ